MTVSFYDNVARTSSVLLPRVRLALELARRARPLSALDVGAGDGENTMALGEAIGCAPVCVDISEKAVQACSARGLEAHRVAIGEAPLPFDDASFDLVHMAEVLEHLVHPDEATREIRRVLKPGGHLVLSTPNLACLPNRALLALGLQPLFSEVSSVRVLGRGWRVFGQGGRPVGHLRLYTKRALREFLTQSGFVNVRLRGVRMHRGGWMGALEQVASIRTSWAMLLVAVAEKPA